VSTLQPFSYRGMADLLKAAFGYYSMDCRPLADQPLASVTATEDKERLVFTLTDGRTLTYVAEGDCCSVSWIEHLTVPPDIAGSVVTAVGEREMGEMEQVYGTIRVYETSFRTDRGDIVVEYRNSSNGYYGGNLRGPLESIE